MDLNFILQKARAAPLAHRQNTAREALQECLLAALMQEGFLEHTAFIGGTALRILHRLPRFSEDLDFLCLRDEAKADRWAKAIGRYLPKIGATPHVQANSVRIDPQYGKKTQTLYLAVTSPAFATFARDGLQVSFEFDLDPPDHLAPETRTLAVANTQVSIPTLELPSLMAGKLHILLTRCDREKGRDWYDYLWYRRRDVVPNVPQLQSAIAQTTGSPPAKYWMSYLRARMARVRWEDVRSDVRPFLENAAEAASLAEPTLANLTPSPDFAAIRKELTEIGVEHALCSAADDDPVYRDIQQFATEGDSEAIELRDELADLRKQRSR